MEFTWVYGIIAVIIAYLFGSIPTSVWWGKAFFGIDVRQHGSRNAGATNTFRVLGWRAGVPVLLIDIAKGFVPVRLLPMFSDLEVDSDGWVFLRIGLVLAAVIGHLYPVFANFKGGKGVATSFGGVLAIHPGAAALCVLVFAIIFALTKFVSLGSMCAAIAYPLAMILLYHETSPVKIGFSILLSIIVFYTHRQNIGRLLRGEENRMSLAGRSGPHQ
jgi:acyl phosphate:glycerol-3-phosphate acyltransferase